MRENATELPAWCLLESHFLHLENAGSLSKTPLRRKCLSAPFIPADFQSEFRSIPRPRPLKGVWWEIMVDTKNGIRI